MKTFNLLPIIILLITPIFLISQTKIDSEVRTKIRSTSLNRAFKIINEAASGDRDYVFKPDSIRIFYSLDEAQPNDIKVVAIMAIKWANSNVKEMNIDYMNPAIPDERFIYTSTTFVTKIQEFGTNNFYTFSYKSNGEMTSASYFINGNQVDGDSLSYETFINYHRHYKYDNGWKPYVIYSDVDLEGLDINGYTVETYNDLGVPTTYKYENTSFTNGQDKLFFKPLTIDMILDNYTLENNVFLERPSDNILADPIRYQKYYKNETTGDFELVEKSYAQYGQGLKVQRYSFTGIDSTKVFDGNLVINNNQKIESYTYKDASGASHSGAYEYNAERYVVKETVKAGNIITSEKEYIYIPDDEDGLISFEYKFRDGQGGGETELLEFRYADPLKTNPLIIKPLLVYPNPAQKEIIIELPGKDEICHAEIIDANGRVMESFNLIFKSGKHVLDISKLSAGNYTIIIQSKEGYLRSSFIKI